MYYFNLRTPFPSGCIFLTLLLGPSVQGFGLNSRHHRLGRQIDAHVAIDIPAALNQAIFPTSRPFPTSDNAYSSVGRTSKTESGVAEPFFLQPNAKTHHGIPTLSSESTSCSNGPLVMGYYPDWVSDTFPPEKIDFGRYHWIDFAFAVPTANFSLEWDDERAPKTLKKLVELAHGRSTKVKLSIGGWTGSKYVFFNP